MAARFTAVLAAAWFASAAVGAAPASNKVWITIGDSAYAQLQKLAPQTIARSSHADGQDKVHLVQVDEEQMKQLSEAIHTELKRCGGFMAHDSEEAGRAALKPQVDAKMASLLARPNYTIDQQSVIPPLLSQMQASNVGQTILDLSAHTNRYYNTNIGVTASNWLKQKWTTLANGRSDISVTQFTHNAYPQKSVIATINGTDNGSEVVVLGGHLDSIVGGGVGESTRAPGADDDASGIASLTEAFRVLASSGYKPRRTIKFIGYAAEEVGLRGSQEIAQYHKNNNINVVGVMQLDMTNYKGSANDIYIYTDYTDAQQNTFLANLATTYLPTLKIAYDKCGYGCSDHASWTAQGFWASLPFEAGFNQDNPYIHTVNDTYANTGNQADHALKFSRLALAYAVELGSDGPGTPPGPDRTETFSGKLTQGQSAKFGPFKAGAGTFKASTTGTGDADLFVRKGTPPTTSTYDCKSDGGTAAESCSISVAANGDVHVLVYGYSASSYNLTVTYKPQ
ncbi:M20/M25/M40 family metallo-hydrolase [Massilia sp. BJB1822]|uniref:M20/M25/M40 family metallo-hydrolase n=1 Tax=Massilia sp. BJB1822 TaxID=2744470 RepID=UPI001592C474|nr:M20/M25/M40 family metallo-hydrolase [Massilia sp. BJB1822]NVE00985.1 M20/M25/M40 family metallo-hydrolase [Massilia sp. BJB1822]